MDPLTIAQLVLMVAQILPTIANDAQQTIQVLDQTSTAVKNAQAGDGTIAQADWDALDATLNGDLAKLAAAAQ